MNLAAIQLLLVFHYRLQATNFPFNILSLTTTNTNSTYTFPPYHSTLISTTTMTTPSKGNVALIFGASGITGWAITNASLTYPTAQTFTRIVGLTSRPLSLAASGFPSDPRLQLYSGLDLAKDAESIAEYLKTVRDVGDVTHVYFAGMLFSGDLWVEEEGEEVADGKQRMSTVGGARRAQSRRLGKMLSLSSML